MGCKKAVRLTVRSPSFDLVALISALLILSGCVCIQAKDIVTFIVDKIVQKIEESVPKACDGPPPDLTKLIPELQVDGEGGGLKPINHFNAEHVRELPSMEVEGYDAPIPVVLLVLTSALRAQSCMVRSNVFPGTAMAMRQRHFSWLSAAAHDARVAMSEGTFMSRKWPLQVLAWLLLSWIRAYPNQVVGAIPTRRMVDEDMHADAEKLESASRITITSDQFLPLTPVPLPLLPSASLSSAGPGHPHRAGTLHIPLRTALYGRAGSEPGEHWHHQAGCGERKY
jgi:hypothetical protein